MTRQEIIKFYENKIDDIADEKTREQLFDKLEQLNDIMFDLDTDIENELENQYTDYDDEFGQDDEFMYSCRMPLGEMRGL